ncbi:MAG: hypothetical protein OXD44_06675 [Gammaproteobacteria bacterium]|nr:hypothetical protein [Gammaproteobacteria bacterium]MCY4313363.1 hypothetical protein [Gammaproteobacteria bacterium]
MNNKYQSYRKNRNVFGLFCIIAVCSLMQTGVLAQSSNTEETNDEQDQAALQAISVTATRNPIDPFEYPGMVIVIDRDQIEQNQASTVDDMLRFVPGVPADSCHELAGPGRMHLLGQRPENVRGSLDVAGLEHQHHRYRDTFPPQPLRVAGDLVQDRALAGPRRRYNQGRNMPRHPTSPNLMERKIPNTLYLTTFIHCFAVNTLVMVGKFLNRPNGSPFSSQMTGENTVICSETHRL